MIAAQRPNGGAPAIQNAGAMLQLPIPSVTMTGLASGLPTQFDLHAAPGSTTFAECRDKPLIMLNTKRTPLFSLLQRLHPSENSLLLVIAAT